MKKILLLLVLFTAVRGSEKLDQPLARFRVQHAPVAASLQTLARSAQLTLLVDAEVTGDVTVELEQTTVRAALEALTVPQGLYYEETPNYVVVKRFKTVLYTIDYPQLTRRGSGNSSVTLGGSNGAGQSNGSSNFASGSTAAQPNSGASSANSDATQISISQENQNTFWSTIEGELRSMLKDGELLVLNRFSGIAQITTSLPRHAVLKAYIALVNDRITQQVEIEARLVEVTLRDERKLGVDWELAATSLGGVALKSLGAPTDVAGAGGNLFSAGSFTASLGLGSATAVIKALQAQGDVKTVLQPRLRTLNNQTAFIKVGEDRPFFRLQQATTLQQPGATTPFNQTQESFSVTTITIGNILAVTPQVGTDGVITLDVLPAITRLQAIVTSPDGRQTAPVTEVKQASTIVRMRDGETAVIGGLISESDGTATRAVPVLGALPLLGRAFRSEGRLKTRSELVIFLTPRLVRR